MITETRNAHAHTARGFRRELRRALARQLHDGPIRELSASVVQLEVFRHASDNPDMQVAISAIEERTRTALTSLRRMISELRDEVFEEDLALALRAAIDRFRSSGGAELALVISPEWPQVMPGSLVLNIVRIVQEALQNALTHGQASSVLVELKADRGSLEISVSDDGRGIAPGTAEGTGMLGMRERAALLGGRLSVHRRHPGTEIRVDVSM